MIYCISLIHCLAILKALYKHVENIFQIKMLQGYHGLPHICGSCEIYYFYSELDKRFQSFGKDLNHLRPFYLPTP